MSTPPPAESARTNPFLPTFETPPTHISTKDEGALGEHKVSRSQPPESRSLTLTNAPADEFSLLNALASPGPEDPTFLNNSSATESAGAARAAAKTPTTEDQMKDGFVWLDKQMDAATPAE